MSKNREHPVFFDPNNKRWPRLRRGVYLSGLALTLLFGILILSILVSPALMPLQFAEQPAVARVPPPDPKIETAQQRRLRVYKQKLEAERLKRAQAVRVRPNSQPSGHPLTAAFFVPWDDTSPSSLRVNLSNPDISIDMVITEWLHLRDGDGTLGDEEKLDEIKKEALNFVRTTRPDTRVMALVNNFNGSDWEADKLDAMLANPQARAHCIEQLLDTAESYNLQGVSIDFENILDKSQPALLEFLAELRAAFQPAKLEVSINLPANNDSFDYARIASLVDYVILMVYDQHYASKDAGPVAAIDWFTDILTTRQRDVPASKTIVAIGNYAYDWPVGDVPQTLTFEDAIIRARDNEVERIELDAASLNPTFSYDDYDTGKPVPHTVWMLDAVSAFNQVAVANSFAERGVALWRLGGEDPSIWSFFGRDLPLDADTAARLSTMVYGYDLDYTDTKGEILRVKADPKPGSRTLQFDAARGFVTAETIERENLPSPYVIERYGHTPRKLALTFDDGPDPEWTPQILDALKQANAPGTFFVIGLNAEQYPDLIRREVNEGHEIGNHTFTHPNIANISNAQFSFELAATRVLMESIVGRRTYLFRPPYAEDAEPVTPDEARPLEAISERGYLTVGMQIDPDDWQGPKAETIRDRVIAKAGDPSDPSGNVILLHDAGGDRSETIRALPMLISEMRKRGFEFVTVSELLGKSRDEVMPVIDTRTQWRAMADRAAFDVINFGIKLIRWLFLIGIILGIARLLFIGTLAVLEHRRERHARYDPGYSPTVAIIVPAYNEEKVIVQTITSLLASDHPPGFEIVVVDDGSKDATYARVKEAFSDEPRVRVFTTANGGKPAALNYGVTHTAAEIVIALDADTIFARDTISKLVRHFSDPKVGAVAGNAKVGNRLNLLTRWQALEYITSQNLDRRAFNFLNCITVVPGAVGAWRRELVVEAGGFTDETLAEDADLTMAIRKRGYSIVYEDEAIALTEAPDTVRGFVKQRYRWMYGTLQAAWKHKDALFRPRYGSLGFVALPNIFIFQVLFPLISPAMDLLMLVTLVMTAADRWQHPDEFSADSLKRALFYYAVFMTMEFLSAALAFVLEMKENRRLLVWLFLQRFFYRQLMYYVAIKSFFASLRGIAVGWNKLERKATVKA